MPKKVYISGKIKGDANYKRKFKRMEKRLKKSGYVVMNPAVLPDGFEFSEYMLVCFAMIDACDTVIMLQDWEGSRGARLEFDYAKNHDKIIIMS